MKSLAIVVSILVLFSMLVPYLLFSTLHVVDDAIDCRDWARTPWNNYLLENNVWGDKSAEICSFTGDLAGWFWRKPFPSTHPIYPEIIYGKKPWLKRSTTPMLPIRIRELLSLTIEANYTTIARGKYNVLIDIWITRSKKADPRSITAEIGIYLKLHDPPHDCELVEIDGHHYCYRVTQGGAGSKLYQFMLLDPPPERLDLVKFIRFTGLDRDLYVASVEFGNEVWWGYGVTIIKYFNVTVIDP